MHTSEDIPAIVVGIRETRALLDHHSAAAIECGALLGKLLTAAKDAAGARYPLVLHQLGIGQGSARQWIALARRQEKKPRRQAQSVASS